MAEHRPFRVDGVYDLETASWDSFVVGVTYDGHLPKVHRTIADLVHEMRSKGGVWWAHAGGTYDAMAVLEYARQAGISCGIDRSAQRVTRVTMGNLTLRDSYSIWPVPLDEVAGALGRPVPALPWSCICEQRDRGGCGGYCRITTKMIGGDPDLDDYCIADCRILYDGLHLLNEFALSHGIHLRGTMGQTSWVAAQSELGIPDSEISWKIWRHARKGDKGGRAHVIRPRPRQREAIRLHDVCNAYPAQLAKADLPVGRVRELGGKHAARALSRCKPGIYTLTVNVPDDLFLPPLPWTCGGQLCFPTGTFSGSWTLPELAAAFERGVSIVEVSGALVYQATSPIFAAFIERLYAIRKAIGRKTPFGQWIGRFAKAVTGKLAERPERNRVVMFPDEIKICDRSGRCRNGCTKRCGAYEQLDLFGHIWSIPFSHLGPSAYPQWSAYLRAMTRVQWLEQAEKFGTDLVMGNTDSLWTMGRHAPSPLGDELGQWEFQDVWTEFEARSVSTYAGRDRDGAFQIRGIPGLTEDDWKRGSGVIDRGVVTLGNAVRSPQGLFQRRSRRWSLPNDDRAQYGDRLLGSGGVTYPMDAKKLRELANAAKLRASAAQEARERGRENHDEAAP